MTPGALLSGRYTLLTAMLVAGIYFPCASAADAGPGVWHPSGPPPQDTTRYHPTVQPPSRISPYGYGHPYPPGYVTPSVPYGSPAMRRPGPYPAMPAPPATAQHERQQPSRRPEPQQPLARPDDELAKEAAECRATVASQRRELEALAGRVAQLEDLDKALTEARSNNRQLQQRLNETEQSLRLENASLAESLQVERATVATQREELEALAGRIAQLEGLDKALTEARETSASLRARLTELDRSSRQENAELIVSLKAERKTVAQQGEEIARLSAELEALQGVQRALSDARNANAALEQALAEKDRSLRLEIASLAETLEVERSAAQTQQREIEELETALTKAQSLNTTLTATVAELESKVEDTAALNRVLAQERERAETLEVKLAELRTENAQIAGLRDALEGERSRVVLLQSEVAELEAADAARRTSLPADCLADADADGVIDRADLCPESPAGTEVDALGCAADATIVLRGVNFQTGSDRLTPESLQTLDRVAEALQRLPNLGVEVAGHTDSRGDPGFNRDLSLRRATAVKDYLLSRGLEAERLQARGYGEEQPIADNDTAEGRAANRRVELLRLGLI